MAGISRPGLALPLALAAICCAGGDDRKGANTLMETCFGVFDCDEGGDDDERYDEDDELEARQEGSACVIGAYRLEADGAIGLPGGPEERVEIAWSGDSSEIAICLPGEPCIACQRTGDGDGSHEGQPAASCHGSPYSCSSGDAGHCSSIDGCHFHSHIRWDGSVYYECDGSADSCDSMSSQESCESQGCDWY